MRAAIYQKSTFPMKRSRCTFLESLKQKINCIKSDGILTETFSFLGLENSFGLREFTQPRVTTFIEKF